MTEPLALKTAKLLRTKVEQHLDAAKQAKLIPLIAVIGPTASGKTALGIALARAFDGEIISADSRKIYREMNIGTAKPTSLEQQSAVHHLIDVVSPDQTFTLADFQKIAQRTIADIFKRHKLPILVGGTGLYINSVTQNYHLPDSKPDLQLREQLEEMAKQQGKEAVYQLLLKLDPESAKQIHFNNLRYVIRAIEIAKQTHHPKSAQTLPSPYLTLYLSIDWPRQQLYELINRRIDGQVATGLIEETQQLFTRYPQNLPALTSLGYQEIGLYLDGETTLEKALEEFKKHTRNYAKRQLTWFRKIKSVYSIPGTALAQVISALQSKNSEQ